MNEGRVIASLLMVSVILKLHVENPQPNLIKNALKIQWYLPRLYLYHSYALFHTSESQLSWLKDGSYLKKRLGICVCDLIVREYRRV